MPTLTVRTRRFPTNTDIVPSSMYNVVNGSSATFSTSQYLTLPDPSDPTQFQQFVFLFWNVKGAVYSTNSTTVSNVGSDPLTATSWYLLTGGGGGTPNVSAHAFSITQNQTLTDSPIQSVTPSSAWPGGNSKSVDTTGSSVQVNAKSSISGENFDSWMVFGSGSVNGAQLDVSQNNSAIAIATYKEVHGDPVDPRLKLKELVDIFDRLRGKLGDWVTDPAPIDLMRLADRYSQEQLGEELELDELAVLTSQIADMDLQQLEVARSDLSARIARLETAQEMVDAVMKGRK